MENVLNQSIGIDIAKDSFTACICTKYQNQSFSFSPVRLFKNEKNGFNQLLKWTRKNTLKSSDLTFAMEATGVYFEPLAFHLSKIKCSVSVILPNKVKYYAKSLNIKSKNDFIDARVIAQMVADRELQKWTAPKKAILKLRSLTRLNNQLQIQRHVFCNMMHSKEFAVGTPKEVIATNQKIIDTISKQIVKTQKQIRVALEEDPEIYEKVKKIEAVKGLSTISIATVIAETRGFELFKNVRQLVSFCGLDVVQFESGTSIKKRTKLSKKGNKHIRRVLYMPAMTVARMEPQYKAFYDRINEGRPSKKPGIIAVQRKILILMFSLWRSGEDYNPNHLNEKQDRINSPAIVGHHN